MAWLRPNVLIAQKMGGQKLQRYLSVELEILGLPNLAHSAGTEALQDLVMADGRPTQDGSILALMGLDSASCRKQALEQTLR